MKRFYLILFLGIIIAFQANAQQFCGTSHINKQLEKDFPHITEIRKQNEALIYKALAKRSILDMDYVIPVVVHVIHTGGAIGSIYNPSDATIIAAIDKLNAIWNGSYPGMTPPGSGAAGNMQIQFALAQRTTSCGATNGIVRYNAGGIPAYVANGVNSQNSNGLPDAELKALSHWPGADYYNIYIVNKIDGWDGTSGSGTAGYAYYPGAPENLDGTVALAFHINHDKVLPHELGHAFNLYHPFEGSSNDATCPPNEDCMVDNDKVCDTDPVTIHQPCRTGINMCTGTSYNLLTENNIMAYTDCATLFTAGQKNRAQAAMTLPSRQSLADSDADLPCAPEINFSIQSLNTPESQSTTEDGCRLYRDYTFQLTIGTAPSATAIVSIGATGIAVTDLDYILTTNNDFNAPSNEVIFPSGIGAPQEVKIRIFDDLNAEGTENIQLDMTINANGGNAVIGSIYPTMAVTILDNDEAPALGDNGSPQVGNLGGYFGGLGIFNRASPRVQSYFIIHANDLSNAGIPANATLNSLGLIISQKNSDGPFNNFSIGMGHTPSSFVVDNGSLGVIPTFQTVYSNAAINTIVGPNQFDFDSDFVWNGGDNIMVRVCWDNGTTGTGSDALGLSVASGTNGQIAFLWTNNSCSAQITSYFGVPDGRRLITLLGWETESTPIEDEVINAPTAYMSVGSNEHLYSDNDKVICSVSGISQPLGCVSAGIVSAGSTWVDGTAGQRSAKVFSVTPTTNGSSADYTATFYYTAAELSGKNPATLRLAKSTASSVANITEGNTVYLTASYAPLGDGAMFTADFSGFSLFFLADEDFTLPVELLQFTAEKSGQNEVLVQWTSVSQESSETYQVQRSMNGQDFQVIHSQPAKINSITPHTYLYRDLNLQPANYFYRMKIIDLDEAFVYSPVVKVGLERATTIIVYPTITTGALTIESKAENVGNWIISIIGLQGNRIYQEMRQGMLGVYHLKLPDLSAGTYLLRVENEKDAEVFKFVKK